MIKNDDEIALIITASMMEAGMRDDQEISELPVTIRKLKEQVTYADAKDKLSSHQQPSATTDSEGGVWVDDCEPSAAAPDVEKK